MHPSSKRNMARMRDQHLRYLKSIENPIVCDVGGRYSDWGDGEARTYRGLFSDLPRLRWVVCDVVPHESVTHVMPDPYTLPFPDQTFDLVVSGQMLEHCSNPFKSVAEMRRVLKAGCRMVLIAPSAGPYHGQQDGWRFMGDAFKFIIDDVGGIRSIADEICADIPGEWSVQWRDHVFVGERV